MKHLERFKKLMRLAQTPGMDREKSDQTDFN